MANLTIYVCLSNEVPTNEAFEVTPSTQYCGFVHRLFTETKHGGNGPNTQSDTLLTRF